MKKIIKIKIALIIIAAVSILTFLFIVVTAVCGYKTGQAYAEEQANQLRANTTVINNHLYAEKYKRI